MKTLVVLLLLVFTSFSQPLKYKENSSIEGCYTVFNGREFISDEEGYRVYLNGDEIINKVLPGKKVYISSADNSFLAVAAFSFGSDKSDIPVTIDVYDNSLESDSYTFTAPFDLPHPSINITDNGQVILFDPMSFSISVLSEEVKKEYKLEKEIDFEMERSFFTATDRNNFYVLINERALSPEEDTGKVILYISGFDFTVIEKKQAGIDIPAGLYLFDDKVIISGADFNKGSIYLKSFIMNGSGVKEIPYAFEKLLGTDNGYAGKYGSTLYILDNDFEEIGRRDFENYIADIAVTGAGTAVLIREERWRFYNIGEDMEITNNFLTDHPGGGNPPVFGFAEDTLLMQSQEHTYIFNEFVRRTK